MPTSSDKPLFLYNTLTGKKEEFKALHDHEVRMYTCGPTVYNFAHIGNLRAYVFADTLRRTLEWNGYGVKQVVNVTDVGHLTSDADSGDDKMIKALKREGKPFTLAAMREVADFYKDAFVSDLKSLNIELPAEMPQASDHILEDIELIKILEEKGFAYKTSDGIYFDTDKFPDYGKLGKINLEGRRAGARVAVNSQKKNPADFTLWKKAKNDIGWPSPWGLGFPGWHVECSAMSRKYLGQPFDIHTGGVDHVGTHHNNEIAQSEAAYGVPLANYWMHNEHLNIASGKMAKSEENFLTLKNLSEKNIAPSSYRYYLLGAGYRKPMIFSEEALRGAAATLGRLVSLLVGMPSGGKTKADYEKRFAAAINDDLNTPDALAIIWELVRDEKISPADRRATTVKFDEVLGLNLSELIEKETRPAEVPPDVARLIKERETARADKNWKMADELRGKIEKLGFKIKDTETSSKLEKI